jgi:glutamyl-tRNA(Gln) amidotransferase subunit E
VLAAKGVNPDSLTLARLESIFKAMKGGAFAKEALPQVLEAAAREPGKPVEEIVRGLGITTVGEAEVTAVARRIVKERGAFVSEKGEVALGPLMGLVMKELRGKADGGLVSRVVAREIQATLGRRGARGLL